MLAWCSPLDSPPRPPPLQPAPPPTTPTLPQLLGIGKGPKHSAGLTHNESKGAYMVLCPRQRPPPPPHTHTPTPHPQPPPPPPPLSQLLGIGKGPKHSAGLTHNESKGAYMVLCPGQRPPPPHTHTHPPPPTPSTPTSTLSTVRNREGT